MALYHTHRPQDYAELIGQEYIVKTLSNQIASDSVAHAYLFSGPRGVGKTTTARILSKAVNCTERKKGESNPCNTCISCKEITTGNAIDVMEIDAASNTGVDNVRANIIDNAQFKPTKSRFKIFIIDEVHMLSTSAFNALLKIMEEPPAHVLFILATTELHKIPDTIISRCQRFQFKRVPYDILSTFLNNIAKKEGYKIDQPVVDTLIVKSDGCVRDAISLLDQLMALGAKHISQDIAQIVLPSANKEQMLRLITCLIEKDSIGSFKTLSEITADLHDMIMVADDLIDMLRHLMIVQIIPTSKGLTTMDDKTIKQLHTLAKQIKGKDLIALIDLILRRRLEIKSSPLPQLPLEMVIIEWCDESTHDIDTNRKEEVEAAPRRIQQPVSNAEKIVTPSKNFSLQDTEKIWGNFLTAVEQQSPSLVFILKMANLTGVEGNTVVLSIPYSFHRDKLMDMKTKELLQKNLSELLGTQAFLHVVTKETSEQKKQELNELATLVGGDIV